MISFQQAVEIGKQLARKHFIHHVFRFSLCCSPALFFFFHTLAPETAALQVFQLR
ncbi:hypothetical protein CsSME_00006313 [Camellia sinensis var. sinensis]